jgi:SAM-dependent methyltransferase
VTSDRLRRHYTDKYTGDVDDTQVEPLALGKPAPADRYQAAVAFLPSRLPDAADILEMGAGNGVVAQSLLSGGVPFASYTIGDISPPRLAGLRRTFTDQRFRMVEVNAEDASADIEGPFDAVIMVALIEHLVDPMGAMGGIRALLKPGGFVYIDTPNIAKWSRRAKLALGKFPSTASTNEGLTTYAGDPADLHDEGHLHYFTFRSLRLMLTERCGYSHVEELGYYLDNRFPAIGHRLAARRPAMFSEIAMVAYA